MKSKLTKCINLNIFIFCALCENCNKQNGGNHERIAKNKFDVNFNPSIQ